MMMQSVYIFIHLPISFAICISISFAICSLFIPPSAVGFSLLARANWLKIFYIFRYSIYQNRNHKIIR